jgi:hypothetical protein
VGKNRKAKEIRTVTKSGKAKYIILGIIAAVVAAGAYAAINNDTNSQNPQLSVDTSKGSPVLGLASAPVTIIELETTNARSVRDGTSTQSL